jgi:DNA-binding NarL/FixJ family response regulator
MVDHRRQSAAVDDGEGDLSPSAQSAHLTRRQLEVLRLLAEGESTGQIAADLGLSRTTVRNYIANLLAALGVHTRLQAVIAARRAGILRD